MSNWTGLPTETLQNIMRHVKSNKDQFQCTLVCKGWRIVAQSASYNSVNIISRDRLERFENTLQNNVALRAFVKTLRYSVNLEAQDLVMLSNLIPNVEYFEAVGKIRGRDFHDTMVAIHQSGRFTQAKSIPLYFHIRFDYRNLFIRCALEYSNTLTKIELPDRERFGEPRQFLQLTPATVRQHFPQLEEVHLKYTRFLRGQSFAEFIDSVVNGALN